MEPTTTTIPSYQPPQSGRSLKPIILAASAILVAILIVVFTLSSHSVGGFQVVNTSPTLDKFITITPTFTVNFNEALSSQGIKVTSKNNVVTSVSVSGKSLIMKFNAPFTAGTAYTVTINSITSSAGHQMTNKSFTFTPQKTDYTNIPSDQQKALLNEQANQPYTRDSINYSYDQLLVSNGVTTDQLADFKQGIFLYSNTLKKKFSTIILDPVSVSQVPVDPDNPSSTFEIDFNLTIDGTPYTARLEYTRLSTARLLLSNPANSTQLYDSGDIDLSANPS